MKTTTIILTIATLYVPTLIQAEEKKNCAAKKRAAALEKFDADGNGELSEEEKNAAKAAMAKRKAAFIAKYDTNGDGKLDQKERVAAKAAHMAKYDTNSDGKLSEEERKAARDAGDGFLGKPHKAKKLKKKAANS